MPTETEIYTDERLDTFEAEPAIVQERDAESVSGLGEESGSERYDSALTTADARGGETSGWKTEYSSAGDYRFERGQMLSSATGESFVDKILRENGPEEAAMIEEGQKQWLEGNLSPIRARDHVEETDEGTTLYVTEYFLGPEGTVSYEIRSYFTPKQEDEDPSAPYESTRTINENSAVEFTEHVDPEDHQEEGILDPSYMEAAASAEVYVDAKVEIVEATGHQEEVESLIDVDPQERSQEDSIATAPQPEIRATGVQEHAENWIQAFFERDPLGPIENESRQDAHIAASADTRGEADMVAAPAVDKVEEDRYEAGTKEVPEEPGIPETRTGGQKAYEVKGVDSIAERQSAQTENIAETVVTPSILRMAFAPEARSRAVTEQAGTQSEVRAQHESPRREDIGAEKSVVAPGGEIARTEVRGTRVKPLSAEKTAQRTEEGIARITAAPTETRKGRTTEMKQGLVARETREKAHGTKELFFGSREHTLAPSSEVSSRVLERGRSARVESARLQSPELLRRPGASQSATPFPVEETSTARRAPTFSRNGITLRKAA